MGIFLIGQPCILFKIWIILFLGIRRNVAKLLTKCASSQGMFAESTIQFRYSDRRNSFSFQWYALYMIAELNAELKFCFDLHYVSLYLSFIALG